MFFLFRRLWSKLFMLLVFVGFVGAVMPGGVRGLLARLDVNTGVTVRATVIHVIRGDTIGVLGHTGESKEVRLLGVNAPRMRDCYGREAQLFVEKKMALQDVRVRTDVDLDKYDENDRVQAYVYDTHGRNLNAVLLRRGYARVALPQGRRFRLYRYFRAAEARARTHRRGLWGACPSS